jgi:ATP-dependent DNA helicase RecG
MAQEPPVSKQSRSQGQSPSQSARSETTRRSSVAIYPDTRLQYLRGVGPKLGELFAGRGLATVSDLLEWYPRAYEDRRVSRQIATLQAGELVSIRVSLQSVRPIVIGRGKRKIYDVTVGDATGKIHCKYFRVPFRGYFERFQPMQTVRLVGRVIDYRGRLEFHHPDIQDDRDASADDDHDILLPIYPETEGLSNRQTRKLVSQCLELLGARSDHDPFDMLPGWVRESRGLMGRFAAIQAVHRPDIAAYTRDPKPFQELRTEAHKRLIFDEFFWLELTLAARRSRARQEQAESLNGPRKLTAQLESVLPFQLTSAQRRTMEEVDRDLVQAVPMHRLVQGDVGSGKTVVALWAALRAIESGFQAALMAPTEILAEQHARQAQRLLEPLGVTIGFLSGSQRPSEKAQSLKLIESGVIQLAIGTHALIQEGVAFQRLGLAIVDEQHRFGVHQRAALKQKAHSPHLLVMTATPIPRSLAMTVYGDLDVSRIDEMPKGRSPIQTRVTYQSKRAQVCTFVQEQLQKGRQAYVVYPLIEESEKLDLQDAVSGQKRWEADLPGRRVALLHGRMRPDEKDAIMERFRRAEIDVLVSTTVIEVGVDVPNATLMIIENAERFGLSQLHQLRGRVGRGPHKSFCILICGPAVSEEARQRTSLMEETTDGFRIAERDLEIRGPGEFLGTRQSGLPGFKLGNLVRDYDILVDAREAAFSVLKRDPKLSLPEHKSVRERLAQLQRGSVGSG